MVYEDIYISLAKDIEIKKGQHFFIWSEKSYSLQRAVEEPNNRVL